MNDPRIELMQYLTAYREGFGGGMVPFDMAYEQARRNGRTQADAEKEGGYALLEAFVEFCLRGERSDVHPL